MRYLAVRNLNRFQHYRNRRPLWVKLYLSTLRDAEFAALSMASRLVFVFCLLIAADRDNQIPEDAGWLAVEMNLPRKTVANSLAELLAGGYLIPASTLANGDGTDLGVTEKETEKETTTKPHRTTLDVGTT